MSIGLVGRKSGMTRIFTEDGSSIPVTVVEVQPNRVTQIKTIETDGYSAVQVTTGNAHLTRLIRLRPDILLKLVRQQVRVCGNFGPMNLQMLD